MKLELDFNGLITDLEFKYLFSHSNILKDFINSYFKYINVDKEVVFTSVDAEKYIMADEKKIRNFFCDIVCTLNTGEIIILEAYSKFSNREYKKSYNYMARHYSNQMNKESNYEDTKKVICLNVMLGNFKRMNNEIVNSYIPKNKVTNKVIETGEMEFVLIRLDKVSKMVYTDNRFIKWLKFINAKEISELEEIGRNDEIMEQSIEYIKRYCAQNDDHAFEDYVAEKEYVAKKDGERQGILETAKNLLKMGLSAKTVTEATGLSKSEIESLMKD